MIVSGRTGIKRKDKANEKIWRKHFLDEIKKDKQKNGKKLIRVN